MTKNTTELRELIRALYEENDATLMQKFDRSLPFQDGIFDRWDRAKKLNFGEGANIYNSALVFGKVEVGSETWIGPYVILDGSGELKIGAHCSISSGVHIYTHDTVLRSLSGGKMPISRASVTIGDCTYIGAHSVIKAGVDIGSHCIVGANSFVNKSVPDNTIVAGSPAKPIGKVVIQNEDIKLEYF